MKRIESLDSLRGIAALIVVIHHCAMALPGLREHLFSSYVVRPFLIGPSAVHVFFVLSGMVLYLTLEGKDGFRYLPYAIKRVARIYLPLLAAVITSVVLYLAIMPTPVDGLSLWFNQRSWGEYPTLKIVAGHLLLLDPWRYASLDNVIWSLVYEMRISLIFPLVALALRAQLLPTILSAVLVTVAAAGARAANIAASYPQSVATLEYLALFAAGGALAVKRENLAGWFASKRPSTGITALVVGIVLLCCEQSLVLVSIGAILTVTACFSVPAIVARLEWGPLLWLGRISYSLYLIHLLVLLTLLHLFTARIPTPLLLAITPFIALAAAHLAFRFVERPAIVLGRRLAHRWEGKLD